MSRESLFILGKSGLKGMFVPMFTQSRRHAPLRTFLLFLGFALVSALGVFSADSTAVARPEAAPSPEWKRLTLRSVEARALDMDPVLAEKQLEVDKVEQKLRELDAAVLLPRFEVETGVGPAPGLRTTIDTTAYVFRSGDRVAQGDRTFDFSEWGPFFGIELTVAQPLNVARYRAGRHAQQLQIKVAEAEFAKAKLDVSEEVQTLYFQRVYALMMQSILDSAAKDLDKAQRKIQGLLDDGDESVAQTDLLELKAGRYSLEKGRKDAWLGVQRTDLGLRFLLAAPDSVPLLLQDSLLSLRPEALPGLDTLKVKLIEQHPDLQRLRNGLAAREELVRVARGQIGPDIFLFGNFKYTKAWSSDRESGGSDPFARDPLNELTGVGGIGLRLRLNFWQQWEKFRKERIELQQLRRTEVYAARGLLLKLTDAYVQVLAAKGKIDESVKAMRAGEAWLKAAAMKYDLDPSLAKGMISPYKTVLTAKRDHYDAVLEYNVQFAKLLKAVGWTLADFFRNFPQE